MRHLNAIVALSLLSATLTGCGGGGSIGETGFTKDSSSPSTSLSTGVSSLDCDGSCLDQSTRLLSEEVREIISRVAEEAERRGRPGTVAVVDRVGNVLAVYSMSDARGLATISSTHSTGSPVLGGFESVNIIPSSMVAISKAITGAYLSTEGNAFSTRTASQIIQENFNPGETNQPSGPLFGVQFSQLPCSDLMQRYSGGSSLDQGPMRSPLGLSADPGGFPLYKNGTPVGGVGFIGDGNYGLDRDISGFDQDLDEVIALAGTIGYEAPKNRRADVITAGGKTLRYADVSESDLLSGATPAKSLQARIEAGEGRLLAVTGYYDAQGVRSGTAFGQPDSGIIPSKADFLQAEGEGLDAFILVDSNGQNRFPPRSASDSPGGDPENALQSAEVSTLLSQALKLANRSRAQIRRPFGSQARVTVSIVDTQGQILGIARSRDGPVFGIDVSLQKARTATFFSSSGQVLALSPADILRSLPKPQYLQPVADIERVELALADSLVPSLLESSPMVALSVSFDDYLRELQQFLGLPNALESGGEVAAFADRSGGNLSRPYYPDGVEANPNGPLSKPRGQWSVFSVGLQSDLIYNDLIHHVAHVALDGGIADVDLGCVGNTGFDPEALFLERIRVPQLANGIQIFPGSVPIFRGDVLVGGIGVSGDGVDQDDMIAFLAVHKAGEALDGRIQNAPIAIRADTIDLPNNLPRLRYVSCPQAPFLDSNEDNVCDGL